MQNVDEMMNFSKSNEIYFDGVIFHPNYNSKSKQSIIKQNGLMLVYNSEKGETYSFIYFLFIYCLIDCLLDIVLLIVKYVLT